MMIMRNDMGRKVYVEELGEEGRIVNAKRNWAGRIVYSVQTENFANWSCYRHEMEFIQKEVGD